MSRSTARKESPELSSGMRKDKMHPKLNSVEWNKTRAIPLKKGVSPPPHENKLYYLSEIDLLIPEKVGSTK